MTEHIRHAIGNISADIYATLDQYKLAACDRLGLAPLGDILRSTLDRVETLRRIREELEDLL